MNTRQVTARLDSLTGVRFVAALMVFLFHTSGQVSAGPVRDVLSAVGGRGFVGVTFFYILSGFVLTWSRREGDRPSSFYRRRFARIAPVYWICLVLSTLFTIYASGDVSGPIIRALPSVIAAQSWVPDPTIYFAGNGPGWSISDEAFFYALFPAIAAVLVAGRRGRLVFTAVAAVLVVLMPLVLHPEVRDHDDIAHWALYIFPVQRLGEFLVGVLLAAAMRRGWRPPVNVPTAAALTIGAYVATAFVPYWAQISLIVVVPFALLLATAATADVDGRRSVLRAGWLVRLGTWSYAFYLVHSVIVRLGFKFADRVGLPAGGEVVVVVACLGATVVAAGLLYTFVERPLELRLRGSRAQAPAPVG